MLIDSITQVTGADRGAVVVTGSHGGLSSGWYAANVAARLYVFNDAGVGRDRAGVAALADLDRLDLPAVAVTHMSARIGDAADTWARGLVAESNGAANRIGARTGETLRDVVAGLTA